MKHYSNYGINEFIICCGYKGEMIQEYFKENNEKWDIKTIDTGLETMTGGRLKKIQKYVNDETFCVTYGDDLKNINIDELIEFHNKSEKSVTLSAFQPRGRFGLLELHNDDVLKISEKIPGDGYWYNGGYYVVEPNFFEYLENLDFKNIGKLEAAVTSGGLSTMPWTYENKLNILHNKTLRYEGHWEQMKAFRELGLFQEDLIDFHNVKSDCSRTIQQ